MREKLNQIVKRSTSDQARFHVIIAFFVIAFLTGGGSRGDITSLVVLRPLAILFCAYALSIADPNELRTVRMPLFMLTAIIAVIALQLVPLPPLVWQELPKRAIYGDIGDLMGIEQPWRPINLSPSGGWNSLFSTTIPLAALLLYAVQTADNKRKILYIILGAALCSGLIGLLQFASSSTDLFYFYRITNEGLPVGLFANRNHQALLFAISIVIFGWWAHKLNPSSNHITTQSLIILFGIIFSIVMIFILGSRAGLAASVFGIFVMLMFLYFSPLLSIGAKRGIRVFGYNMSLRAIVLSSSFAVIVGITLLVVLMSRSLALDRLLQKVPVETLRSKIFPALIDMGGDFLPYGSGFGSFQRVFYQFETTELLRPQYLNHAHNDWIEFIIEGGVAAILTLAVFVIWFLVRCFQISKRPSGRTKSIGIAAISIILIFGFASIVDYPLRVPSFMAAFAVVCAMLEGSGRSKV